MKGKLHDSVLVRFVQIIQEAMLMGVDCVDIMRQVEIEHDAQEDKFVLTQEYKQMVENHHKLWLENAQKLQEQVGSDQLGLFGNEQQ